MKTTGEKNLFDIVVVGAGSGGLTVAISLAGAGKSVLLIEQDKPGGECTHSGCVPSKALLHQAKKMRASGQINGALALEETRKSIEHVYQEETPQVLESHGITYLQGSAVFTDKCVVSVDGISYQFKKAIIATGSSPRMVSIDGLSKEHILTNQNLFEQTELPQKLLVIGSGPIGMEMSQAFAMLGSDVTIASIDSKFARLEDPSISPIIKETFDTVGITTHLNAFINKVVGNTAYFDIKNGDDVVGTEQVDFDKVLVAIGRIPNIPQGLESAGVTDSVYGITVDGNYRTTNKHIYAIGDVSQRLKFTHTANDVGREVVKHILSRGWLSVKNNKAVPKVTFTQPEIAQVGLSYNMALKKYGEQSIMKISVPYSSNDRAKTDHAEKGLVVVVAKRLSGKILGANIIGERAGDLLASYTLAMDHRISLWKLSSTIFPYPTLSQLVKKSGDVFASQTLSSWKQDVLFVFKKNLPKIIALVFWSGLLFWFYHFKMTNGYSFTDMLVMLYQFMTSTLWGPVLYMGAYIIRPLIFFPATLMTMLSGALFGLPFGILYTIIGENGSANFAYAVGRFFGKGSHLEDSSWLGNWVEKVREEPFISVLIMRFIYLPFDLVNYAAGILEIKWRAYALATLLGIIPGLTTFVGFGASLREPLANLAEGESFTFSTIMPDWTVFAFSLVIFVSSLVLARYFKKRHVN